MARFEYVTDRLEFKEILKYQSKLTTANIWSWDLGIGCNILSVILMFLTLIQLQKLIKQTNQYTTSKVSLNDHVFAYHILMIVVSSGLFAWMYHLNFTE